MPELDTLLASSMTALLANSDTKAAIVEYIKSLTDEHKPKEQWREVWYQQTIYARTDPKVDMYTGVKNRKHRLLVVAMWNADAKVGEILALLSGEANFYDLRSFDGMWDYRGGGNPTNQLAKQSALYQDYPDLIVSAQLFWTEALTIWHEKTEPLPEESK